MILIILINVIMIRGADRPRQCNQRKQYHPVVFFFVFIFPSLKHTCSYLALSFILFTQHLPPPHAGPPPPASLAPSPYHCYYHYYHRILYYDTYNIDIILLSLLLLLLLLIHYPLPSLPSLFLPNPLPHSLPFAFCSFLAFSRSPQVQTLMLNDVQTPFLGTPLAPLQALAPSEATCPTTTTTTNDDNDTNDNDHTNNHNSSYTNKSIHQ